uniref:Tnp n=1 Tax=Xanthomonas campestris TaxID=339 RepID=O33872_XANCA|nr:Tnp [Xanthomonas campestris]
MEELLAHTINAAHAMQAVDARELSRVIVDTTVQEKAIAYPTDSRLLEVARKKLVLLAKRYGIGLRQSYARQGPALSRKAGRYAHARQFKRMQRVLRRQRTVLGRVLRDIARKLDQVEPGVRERIAVWLERAQRLYTQRPKDKQKLYALHAPEVECIGKGKARQAYEFGVKVGIAVTACKGLVVGARSFRATRTTRHLGRAAGADTRVAAGSERRTDGGDRGPGLSRARGRWRAGAPSWQGQDADATAMALDQTTAGGGTGDRTSERRLQVASLQAERCTRRCAARTRLRRRLQPALAAALDRVFACLDAGDGMAIL